MSCEKHNFVNSGYSNICEKCGVERMCCRMETVSGYTMNQPLWIGYNRANRFRKMLLALCKPRTHSRVPGKMILHLQTTLDNKKCETMDELYDHIKTASCSDKGYNSMHLYAIMYLKNYISKRPPVPKVLADVVGDFIIIERGHEHFYPNKRFFSYRWILNTLLKARKLDFWTQYVKPLKNKSSNRRYQKMYNLITTVNTHVPILDKAEAIGIRLGRPLDDAPRSLHSRSSESNPSISDPLQHIVEESYPTRCDSLDNVSRPASRVVFPDSMLQNLFETQIHAGSRPEPSALSANS